MNWCHCRLTDVCVHVSVRVRVRTFYFILFFIFKPAIRTTVLSVQNLRLTWPTWANQFKSVSRRAWISNLSMAGAATSIIYVTTKKIVTTNTCLLWQNTSFVATKVCLSRQSFCCHKHIFVTTQLLSRQTFCRNKLTFLTTNTRLSRQNYVFWSDKSMLVTWQTRVPDRHASRSHAQTVEPSASGLG